MCLRGCCFTPFYSVYEIFCHMEQCDQEELFFLLQSLSAFKYGRSEYIYDTSTSRLSFSKHKSLLRCGTDHGAAFYTYIVLLPSYTLRSVDKLILLCIHTAFENVLASQNHTTSTWPGVIFFSTALRCTQQRYAVVKMAQSSKIMRYCFVLTDIRFSRVCLVLDQLCFHHDRLFYGLAEPQRTNCVIGCPLRENTEVALW